ncbi:MAG: hypothetical protein U0350_05885 [Caldilineaceae bacterium]
MSLRSAKPPLKTLTRREFYKLAEYCRVYALELAHYDQTHVNLKQCHEFNRWLAQVKLYDRLNPPLATLKPARPVARWQLLVLGIVLGMLLLAALSKGDTRSGSTAFLYTYSAGLVIFYFVPERFYGTTIELLEGKVLRVVDALEGLLTDNQLDFTDAAFFQAKENLEVARRELRQQIDLVHRD